MAEAVIGVLLHNLHSLAQREFGLLWGVDEHIAKLSSLLSTIQAVLDDAEIKQFTSKPISNWLMKLQDAAYDANDILDDWLTITRHPTHGHSYITYAKVSGNSALSHFSLTRIKFRHTIAKKIKKIVIRFDEIAEERLKFHLSPVFVQQDGVQWNERRETSSALIEDVVFGRDGDREKIIDLLLTNASRGEDVSVFSILGIGGLGKTTLAQLVYQDQRVAEHFDAKMWVCVSDNFEVKRLTKMILESLTASPCALETLDSAQRQLQEKLSGKKYFLVLDDVWNENGEKWRELKSSLTCGCKGSSILVTTRLETVTSIVSHLLPHRLTFLTEEDCWSLFKGRAFGVGSEEPANLVEIGKEIVKKCGGVPLAAKALGGSLFSKREERDWLRVRDSRIWELSHDKESGILPSLRLTYNHLPTYFKQCFAFCSVYPKNTIFDKTGVILLWMANGFLPFDGRMELEEYGNLVFNELLRRSFFQDIEKDDVGDTISCRMHDLMHDLACSVSANKSSIEVTKVSTLPEGIRHCLLHFDLPSAKESSNLKFLLKPNQQLRTLIVSGYIERYEPPQILFRNLDHLRALDLMKTTIQVLPTSIGKMKYLRFLCLAWTKITSLPESICDLRNLEYLGLRGCEKLLNLPERMSEMSGLRHLRIKRCKNLVEMPLWMGQLMHLQTLSIFMVGPNSGRRIKELQGLNQISGEVKIKGLEHVRNSEEAQGANLLLKRNITSLGLYWSGIDSVGSGELQEKTLEALQPHASLKVLSIRQYNGVLLPSWMVLLPKLVKIKLAGCTRCEILPPLGQLPLLKVLNIDGFDSVKCISNEFFGEGDFPSLRKLRISMVQLEKWSWSTSSSEGNSSQKFPSLEELIIVMNGLVKWSWSSSSDENPGKKLHCLKKLVIKSCHKLTAFPSLPCLEHLTLSNSNNKLLGSLANLPPSLHTLEIDFFEELISFPEWIFTNCTALQLLRIYSCNKLKSLPEEIENLTSLKMLQIVLCEKLVSLPKGLHKVTSLENLWLRDCANLRSVFTWLRYQKSLDYLEIKACPKLDLSTVNFQHLTSLRILVFDGLPQLSALPEGIKHLCNLHELIIDKCVNLKVFPEWMELIVSLEYLEIKDCHPDLHRRCKKDKGEEWHKISHIRMLNIFTSPEEPSAGSSVSLSNKFKNIFINNNN